MPRNIMKYLLTVSIILACLAFQPFAGDSCRQFNQDFGLAKFFLENGAKGLEYIVLRNSSRLKMAVFVPGERLRHHDSFVLLRTIEGEIHGFANVPQASFKAWSWADSPSTYFQEKIKPFAPYCPTDKRAP